MTTIPNILLTIIFFLFVFPSGHTQAQQAKNQPQYKWTQLTKQAAFPKSYNFQLISAGDTLWAFHAEGNWFSPDGKTWTKSSLPNSINNLGFLDYVQFHNEVLGLGYLEGNIETFKLTTTITSTTDFKKWNTLAGESNLPQRFFYHPFVFNDKLWIIGGSNGKHSFNDIWSSADGVHWVKQADNLPFGNRENSQFVILNRKIFMLNNDVWSSPDALHWTRVTNEIVKGEEVFGYAAIVYDGRIWLLGCNRNRQFTSKVYSSEEGKTWQASDAPWSPRGGIAACVHNGKIYMTGGKYGGEPDRPNFIYSNDVWMMERIKVNLLPGKF